MADIPFQPLEQIGTYEQWRSQTVIRPPIDGPNGRLYEATIGRYYDAAMSRLFDAINARYPSLCPADGLYLLGAERGVEQFLATTDEYRERLRTAWAIWQVSGTRPGAVDNLSWIGCTNAAIYSRSEFSYPPLVGSPRVQAFARDDWSGYDVLVRQPSPWQEKTWGSGWTWGDGSTWGSTATGSEIADLRRVIRTYASAHEMPVYAYLRFGQSPVWGDWKWGDGKVWGGDGSVTTVVIGKEIWERRGIM